MDRPTGPERALSARLEAVLAAVGPTETLVDVCADHGLLALAAVARGQADRAIAIDLNPAPLAVAEANRRAAGLEESVALRLGDGLRPLAEGEGTALAVAGVGGQLARRLLEAEPSKLAGFRRLVVQPNQQPEEVRGWARLQGWHLAAETLVAEQGRYFPVLAFVPGRGEDPAYVSADFTPEELTRLGPHLLREAGPEVRAYWRAQRDRLAALLRRRPGGLQVAELELWTRALTRSAVED